MKNMKTILKGALALAMVALGITAEAGHWVKGDHYFKLTVNADPSDKNCEVYVSTSSGAPTEWKQNTDNGSNNISSKNDTENVSCWAWAHDTVVGEFLNWKDSDGNNLGTSMPLQRTKSVDWGTTSLWPATETITAAFHVHTLTAGVANGLTITQKCSDPDGNCKHSLYQGGTATLNAGSGKTYDGQPYAGVSASYVKGTHDISENASFTYYKKGSSEALSGAPTDAGEYEVTMTWNGATTTDRGSFTIAQAAITSVELDKTELFYTGSEQSVSVTKVLAGDSELAADDYTVSGNTGAGVATSDTQYTVTVTAKSTSNYKGTGTANWVIKGHTHNFVCTPSEGKLTVVCNGTTTCTIPGGTSLEIVCENKTYDGQPLTATIKDNTPSPSTFASYTSGSYTEITWDDATANAGSHTATFTATVAGQQYQVSKTFTIGKKSIEGATVTLSATSLAYTGADQTVTITSVKIGDFDVTYTEDADSVHTAKAIGTHTVKITANGNFTGAATANWTITNYSGALKSVTAAQTGVGTIEGTTLTVTDSSKLYYDSANQVWYAGLVLTWDWEAHDYYWTTAGYAIFTRPDTAKFTIGDATYTGEYSGAVENGDLTNGTADLEYWRNGVTKNTRTYLNTTTWRVAITPAIIEAAKTAGVVTGTMYAGALPFSQEDGLERSSGIAFQNYTINIPIDANLKLYDEVGNQVYPDAGYVAQVADTKLKYTTLAAAIGAATSDQTVNALAACEKADFTVGANVTVNLAGYGASGATYKLGGDLDNMNAKVTSSKQETVTTDATSLGIETTESEGTYTYSLKYVHVHNWKWASEDGRLYADCTAESCDHNHVEITLTGSDVSYDSKAHGCTLSDTADFTTHSGYAVGGITYYTRDGATLGAALEGAPVNVGTYAAVVVCTKDGCDSQTLRKDYAITQAAMSSVTAKMATASFEYDGTERSNSLGSATLGDYSLQSGDYDLTGIVKSYGSGYSNETYTVTLTGKGNFTGTQTATWTITAPTVEFDANPLTATTIGSYTTGYATINGKTLTVTDSTLLPFNGGWYAGFVIAYPYDVDTWAPDSQVTDAAHLRFRNSVCGLAENQYYTGTEIQSGASPLTAISTDSHTWSAQAGKVTYVKNLTWWAPAITPAAIEQAASEEKTELSYFATLGGIKWSASGTLSTTTFQGVKFADFTITVPFGDGIVLKVPEAATYDLGATVLNKCSLNLAKDAVVTTTVEQAEGKIFTTETGFQIYSGTEGGVTTYACWLATEYVTVPDVANATKVVKVGDEVKEPTEEGGNVYAVLYGDTVTITYTPNNGYETADGTKTIENVTGNVTLEDLPTVTATSYTITYELNGGENDPSNPATYTIEDTVMLVAPTKDGSVFVGWTPSDTIEKGSTGNKTVTANWKRPTIYFIK